MTVFAALATIGVTPDYDSLDYWEGCFERRLVMMRCQQCSRWIHFPRRICPACGSTDVRAEEVSGAGSLYTYVVDVNADPPILGLVELDLDQLLRITAPLINVTEHELAIAMPLRLTWIERSGVPVPAFEPTE